LKSQFGINVEKKALRKIKARENPVEVWFGLGMMGLVGWSVIVPTLIGTAIGAWLDKHYSGEHSWTLSLLVAGLCIGCLNAWLWVSKQHYDMQEKDEGENEDE
jgi:ATP synthase protein I